MIADMISTRRARFLSAALVVITCSVPLPAGAQASAAPRVDERVAQIAQTTQGTPWSFIGYRVTTPSSPAWFVAAGTPRGATLGKRIGTEAGTAILVLSSDLLDQPVETDEALLALTRSRHARLGDRWELQRHEETIARHGGARCARHTIEGREPEDRSPRKEADKVNAQRASMHAFGLACVHPTEPSLLVEVAVSERSRAVAMTAETSKEAEAVIASLAFDRYSERSLQKAAEAARGSGVAGAEAELNPFIQADAAWARYFMAQVLERASPAPADAGARLLVLLEPAAERGLSDAQWVLGRLYLRGGPGVPKDPAKAEALLRRAAERGNPGAQFQLGLSLLSGADGIAGNSREAALWIQRAAFRGLKEAQDMLRDNPSRPASSSGNKGAAKGGARP